MQRQLAFTGSSFSPPLTEFQFVTEPSHPSPADVLPLKQSHTRNLNSTITEKGSLTTASSTPSKYEEAPPSYS
ncbi:hypothetical protein BC830DRAFT_1097917 [Chytriomyces sp. MP71]|nr:hypothetical protein BC830DRAFT_1097917 [Chytriomyces sp. MP71]